jgi:MOSC domain-containing protein YiiM
VERQLAQLRALGVKCPKKHGLTRSASDAGADDEYALNPGDYAENLTLRGIDLAAVSIGDTLSIGADVLLEVTAIGKECHQHCAVYKRLGDCVMPREGVFTKVLRGGQIAAGDEVRVTRCG